MKIRDIAMLCVAMVVGTAPAPATVAAATLREPVMLAQAAPAPAAPAPAATPRTRAAASKTSSAGSIEAHIKDLHARLMITPAQEDLWAKAAQVMRENAAAMDALRKARSEKAATMTAVEDFNSYAEMTEAHVDAIKKFIPVFSALYDSMSDAQKKNTDTIFRRDPAKKASR